MKLTYFSAFAGIGGFDEGIKQSNPSAECVGYSEIDKYAVKIYEKHFTNRTNYGNITEINEKELPDFNMFCGGFPCQDLSIAGKRAGLCGARSGLFHEIIRIIREKQPIIVFLENVTGLLSSNGGWDFATVLTELEKVGYDCEWDVLNSKNYGVPQNRERVFIIGHLRGTSWAPIFPIGENNTGVTERPEQAPIIRTLTAGGHSGGMHSSMTLLQVNNPTHSSGRIYNTDGLSPSLRARNRSDHTASPKITVHNMQPRCGDPTKGGTGHLTRKDGISYCLDSTPQGIEITYQDETFKLLNDGTRIEKDSDTKEWMDATHSRIRRLTPLECERLQGYPDRWTEGISDTQRYKCLGNAVTVNVIKAIMDKICLCMV